MIFTEGTILQHKNAVGCTREETVKQVEVGEESIGDFFLYVPIGKAVEKIQSWKK